MRNPGRRPGGLADRIAAAVASRPGDVAALPRPVAARPLPWAAAAPAATPSPRTFAAASTTSRGPGPAPLSAPTPQPALAPTLRAPRGPAIQGWVPVREAGTVLSLMPGELHFGGEAGALRTLLGSCVAVTLWHPQRRIGGMCHFLLPSRTRPAECADGRYGDDAVAAMVQALRAHGTSPGEYVAHLYGGADTMSEQSGVKFNVGERNIEKGWALIDEHGFQIDGVDVGDHVPRTVTLTLSTGEVQCRRGRGP